MTFAHCLFLCRLLYQLAEIDAVWAAAALKSKRDRVTNLRAQLEDILRTKLDQPLPEALDEDEQR